MLTVIGLFVVCISISLLSFTMSYRESARIGNAVAGLIIPSIVSVVVMGTLIGISYGNYVGLKQKNVIIHQYAESINLYSKLAVPNKNVIRSSEITDLKYQNYQESIKELVQQLRRKIVSYNYILVGKRELGNNIVFSWLIIMPDKDMKTLKMEDFISVK